MAIFSAVPAGLATLCLAVQGLKPLPILCPSLRDFGASASPRQVTPALLETTSRGRGLELKLALEPYRRSATRSSELGPQTSGAASRPPHPAVAGSVAGRQRRPQSRERRGEAGITVGEKRPSQISPRRSSIGNCARRLIGRPVADRR